jgi:LmbE family N-acetylglucosaminyl deacetylase
MALSRFRLAACAALIASLGLAADSLPTEPRTPPPDERYKADILLIVAHPDDETEIGPYLARAIYEEHKRVAVVYGTRGNGGGNAMGLEQAAALGAVREIEARRALASWGIMNVWFLGGPDTPGQDVLRSLETWNHGNALWRAIRIVRLTRPSVIMTWLPLYSSGENHGDHQAASVIATEAFDLAGDPTFFPEQVAAPRDQNDIGNLTEGLQPWQAEKLYFFSDANHLEFLDGKGPRYASLETSPSQHKSYARLATEEMSYHLTQGDSGQMAKKGLEENDYRFFAEPVRLVFGKSNVPSGVTDDVFKGVVPGPIPFAPAPGYRPRAAEGLSAEFGGPWAFYRKFWPAHGIGDPQNLLSPEVNVSVSRPLHLPVLVHNNTGKPATVAVTLTLSPGWKAIHGPGVYAADAGQDVPVQLFLTTPPSSDPVWQTITVTVEAPGQPALKLPMRVNLSAGSMPP